MSKTIPFKVINKINITNEYTEMWNRRTVVLDMKGCGQWEVTKDECYPSTMNEIIAQAVDNICESINLKPPMSVTDCTLISYETEEIGYR